MQPKNIGDFSEYQRSHGHFAMIKKLALPVDNRLRHSKDCVKTLLHVFYQPARFLQLTG